MASSSGISRATLSKIERGERKPSLAAAAGIADALNTPLAQLLGEESDDQQVQIVRGGDTVRRLIDPESGAVRESVLPLIEGVEIVRYVIPGHSCAGPFNPHTAGSREVFMILSGKVEIRAGRNHLRLDAGDIASVPGDLSHQVHNIGKATARMMLILVRPTEQPG